MKQLSLKVLCLTLLIAMSLTANNQDATQIHLSEVELQEIFANPKRSYVYVGREVSNIADVIEEISKLEDNQNSAVWGLKNHIDKGFVIGNYDAVAQALEQAELTLKKHADSLDAAKARDLSQSLNSIINQVIEDNLTLDAEVLSFVKDQVNVADTDATRDGLRLLVINERMNVYGKTKFFKDVTFKDKADFKHFVGFHGNVHFWKNVEIDGNLSVANEVIGCDLTVGCNISMNDSVSPAIGNIIKNGTPFIHNYPGVAGNNTFVGDNAGNFIMTGVQNSGFGVSALQNNTAGDFNTAVGFGALFENTTGFQNTAVGVNALLNNTTGVQNSAVGTSALLSNTTGVNNTAMGYQALFNNLGGMQNSAFGSTALVANTTGNFNTAVGFGALQLNETGFNNTAVGVNALQANTTGVQNSAVGVDALLNNTTGVANTAVGFEALQLNSTGMQNTAVGQGALQKNVANFNTAVGFGSLLNNTAAINNTAVGTNALATNTIGIQNSAVGSSALLNNTTGTDNTAMGFDALLNNTTGIQNTAVGSSALLNVTTGFNNVALGQDAGLGLMTGSNNNYIGTGVAAASAGESNVTRIGNIYGVTTGSVTTLPVIVDNTGQLGTAASTRKVKHNIEDMNDESAAIYKLRPVTFAYNNDTSETKQYGLIAEEVNEVFSDIVLKDNNGEPFTVQYHVLPALIVNELKKLAARVAVLEAHLLN